MPRLHRPLKELHIRVWRDDAEFLEALYGKSELGFAGAMRQIISTYVASIRAQSDPEIDNLEVLTLTDADEEAIDQIVTKGL